MKTILCDRCDGAALVEFWEGGHHSDKIIEDCPKCNGTGRLLSRSYNITLPFGSDLIEYFKADKEICEIIQKLL